MSTKTTFLILGFISFASCKTTANRSRVQGDLGQQNEWAAAAVAPSIKAKDFEGKKYCAMVSQLGGSQAKECIFFGADKKATKVDRSSDIPKTITYKYGISFFNIGTTPDMILIDQSNNAKLVYPVLESGKALSAGIHGPVYRLEEASLVAEILLYGKSAGSKIEFIDANRSTLATVACTDDDPSINAPDRGQGLAWVCKDSKYEFQLAILEAFGQNTGLLNVAGGTPTLLFGCLPYATTGSTAGIPSIRCTDPKPSTATAGLPTVPTPAIEPIQPRCTGVYDFGTYKEYLSLFIDSLSSTKASLHLSAPDLGYSEVLALKCIERAGWPSAAVCNSNGSALGSFQVVFDGDAVVNIFNAPNHAEKLLDLVCH